MRNSGPSEIAPHIWMPEPKLLFRSNGTSVSEAHPLRGLLRHGPFSSGFVPDPIRIATIVPSGERGRLQALISELDTTRNPRERRDYLPAWPGFKNTFKLQLSLAGGNCDVELDPRLDMELRRSSSPHLVLAESLVRAIQRLHAVRNHFDVVLAYLPKRWQIGFQGEQTKTSIFTTI